MALLSAFLQPSIATASQPVAHRPAIPAPPLVVVRALGSVDPGHLRLACRSLLRRYPVKCEIRQARQLADHLDAWSSARKQLDARVLLDQLFRSREPDALVELVLTSTDIYEEEKAFVFGLASLTDRVTVVSLARLASHNRRDTERRLKKLVLHEVGHAFGLLHHHDPGCVMRQDSTPSSLDDAPETLCSACRAQLAERAEVLARPGQIALDRIRGHLARGEVVAARMRVVRTFWDVDVEPTLAIALGRAFLDSEQWNEAISLLEYALKRDPTAAEAHLYRGVALQLRNHAGDRGHALSHFARAIELRPQWRGVEHRLRNLTALTDARAQGPR